MSFYVKYRSYLCLGANALKLFLLTLFVLNSGFKVFGDNSQDETTGLEKSAYITIQNKIDDGNYDAALHLSDSVLNKYPEDSDIRLLRAKVFVRKDNLSAAQEILLEIVDSNPEYKDAWLLLGNIYYWNSEYENAIIAFNNAKTDDFNEKLQLNLGYSYYYTSSYDKSKKLANEILSKDPSNTRAEALLDKVLLIEAQQHLNEGRYSEAAPILAEYKKKYPGNDGIGHRLSQTFFVSAYQRIISKIDQEKYDEALSLSDAVLTVFPGNNDVNFLRASVLIRQDKFDEARDILIEIVDSDPEYKDAWLLLGNIYYWDSKYENAIIALNNAKTDDFDEQLQLNLGYSYYHTNRLEKSKKIAEELLSKDSNNKKAETLLDEIKLKRADQLIKEGKYSEATPILSEFIQKYPQDNDNRYRLAHTFFLDNKNDSAKYHLDILLEKDGLNTEYLELEQNIYLKQNDYESALGVSDKLISVSPGNRDYHFRKAQILYNINDYKDSYHIIDSLLVEDSDDEEVESLHRVLVPLVYIDKVTLSYRRDNFRAEGEAPPPYTLMYLQYARKIEDDTFMARVSRAEWYDMVGFQAEVDYYRMLDDGYLYLNAGISQGILFPNYRLGAEYFHTFDAGFEASIGFRHLNFDTLGINIFTASISEQFGDFLLSYRYYMTPILDEFFSTHIFSVRRYLRHQNYIGLSFATGHTPDENYMSELELYQFRTRSYRLEFFRSIDAFWSFKLIGAYYIEEYFPGRERERFSFEIMLNRIF